MRLKGAKVEVVIELLQRMLMPKRRRPVLAKTSEPVVAYYFCAECGRTSKKITDFREIVSQHATKRLCIGCVEKRKRTHHLTVLSVPLLEVGHELPDGHPSLLDDVPHSPSHNLFPPV